MRDVHTKQRSAGSEEVMHSEDLPGVVAHWVSNSSHPKFFYDTTYQFVLVHKTRSTVSFRGRRFHPRSGTLVVIHPRACSDT
jgi:hypothetical protein